MPEVFALELRMGRWQLALLQLHRTDEEDEPAGQVMPALLPVDAPEAIEDDELEDRIGFR